jgi:hypothetical protein
MADQNINIKLLIDAADAAKTVGETRKAMRDLRAAAMSVEEGSESFIKINTAAGQLQDRLGDLAATTQYLGDDLKNLKGFTSIATGIAGAFSVAQGAAALFGGQNKDLEESILKVQSAMGVLQGIQAVGEVLQKESAASLFIQNGLRKTAVLLAGEQAIATAATAVANGTATITQRALNAAMNANPILALVGLLALAATALFAFSNKTKEADESQKALNDTLSKTRANGEIEIKTFNSQIEALKSLKTGSEDRAIAIKKINDQYGTTLKNLTDEDAFLKQVNIAQKDYVDGAKNRILMKINEAKIESLLTESQIKNEKSKYAASKASEILDKNDLLRKQLKGKTEIEILNSTFVSAEGIEYQRLLLLSRTSKEEADALNKRADNVLNINAKLITNETAQQKAAREKEEADALKAEQDKAKALADAKSKSNKDKQKAEADHLKKMADLNAEYQTLLSELAIETNDNLLEQQQLLLSVSGESEANAIAQQRLDTEVKITEENRKQEAFLRKLVEQQVKIEEEKLKGTGKTVDVAKVTAGQINTVEYQKYLTTQYAITAGITKQGEEAIYSIQIDYSERRRKLFEETTKRVLATDEYERFIDFLNKSKALIKEVEGDAEAVTKWNKKQQTQLIDPIPQDTIDSLNKYYLQYKDNIEGLFDLNRQSNLDQLGANEKSIEILSALYGEKFNIIKKSEEEINKLLEGSASFAINPEAGQIGLSELIKLDNAKVNELLKQLNIDLASNYQTVLETEQKYFEKSIFQNYTAQQQKLTDNKTAYENGDISKRKFNKTNIQIDKDFNDSEKTLKENHEENLLAIGVVYGEKTQEDIVEFGKARKTEKQRQADEEIAIEQKKNAYLIQAGQSLYNALRAFQDDVLANNLARIEQEQEERLAAIDAELLDFDNRDKAITAAEQAKIDERKVIEDKRKLVEAENAKRVRDEKIKQFNINKAMDIIQIGINTAVAVSRALISEKVLIPFIITAGAAEAFFVGAQQPNFAEGGLVVGPGGPKDDMVNANLSNGEVVINAKSSKRYAGVLNAINQAGGGKAIPYTTSSVSNPMPVADNTNMDDFKSLILDIMNRPIETYVKESSITNAQKSQSAQNRRTSF